MRLSGDSAERFLAALNFADEGLGAEERGRRLAECLAIYRKEN